LDICAATISAVNFNKSDELTCSLMIFPHPELTEIMNSLFI
jgi:hypothetical protein